MCELFGVSSPEKIDIKDLLLEFFSHSIRHPDGWGMAFFEDNDVALEKQPLDSRKSQYLKSRMKAISKADNMIAHIRLATKGSVEYENTHPFVKKDRFGRSWTLAHNGTIFDSELLDPMFYEQAGQTDSERILLYIIKTINEEITDPDAEARFRILDRIICEITPGNKVNLLVYDGELLYAHTNYLDSLHQRKEGEGTLFSTRPLGRKEWEPLPMNTLLAFRKGKLEYIGTNHGNEFIDNASKTRHLYLDYAAL